MFPKESAADALYVVKVKSVFNIIFGEDFDNSYCIASLDRETHMDHFSSVIFSLIDILEGDTCVPLKCLVIVTT